MVEAGDAKVSILEAFEKCGTGKRDLITWERLESVLTTLKPGWAKMDLEDALTADDIIKDGSMVLEDFVDWIYADNGLDLCNEHSKEDAAEALKISQMKGRGKRAGVAAPVLDSDVVKDYKKPVYPKEPEQLELIRKTLTENEKMKVLCGHLDAVSLKDLCNAFFLQEDVQGTDVIRQGADGDCLYIIDTGKVDVFVARPDENGRIDPEDRGSKVVSFGRGVLFGELALLYAAPRAATIQVASDTAKFWALAQLDFKMLLSQHRQEQYKMYEGWLRDVDLLKTLNYYELSRLSELLDSKLYDDGEEIVQQGEQGSTFYMLEDGTCSAYITGDHGEVEVKKYVKQGEYFGEVALLEDAPRKASVRATGQGCVVVALERQDFSDILGPLTQKLQERANIYPPYAAFINKSAT
eukprot:TRINITY_DN42198_c0_g2_i1.p1 TRINITY_DN42198_c0_g2~~TRINITY_DN42198_c0_g2_i1.p1  ORF type:complete len:410 (+),score=87.68 TRINITY_DN42198_c0_g2_i1:86-1315(+)